MFGLFDAIYEWFRGLLIDGIVFNFTGLFTDTNNRVNEIAGQVGQTPAGWNAGIFNLIRNLSETVIIPIAGMILTFVLCYELIQLIIEKNNLHDFSVYNIYKWIVKTFCAVYILTHTFDIVIGIFALAQNVVDSSAGVIQGSLNISSGTALDDLRVMLEAMGVGELLGLFLETFIVSMCMEAITIIIFIVIFGRMIEIYLTVSVAPIPLSTMANREWGQIGNNYIKSLFALAFQGFLIMVCVAIYAVLLQSITAGSNPHLEIWKMLGYTILLSFTLLKTGSLSKGLFAAH